MRLVVDFSYYKPYNRSTRKPQQVYKESASPQHMNISATNRTVYNKSTTSWHHDMSRCRGFVYKSARNRQQIHNKIRNKSSTSPHHCSLYITTCCTTNPQQIAEESLQFNAAILAARGPGCISDSRLPEKFTRDKEAIARSSTEASPRSRKTTPTMQRHRL